MLSAFCPHETELQTAKWVKLVFGNAMLGGGYIMSEGGLKPEKVPL